MPPKHAWARSCFAVAVQVAAGMPGRVAHASSHRIKPKPLLSLSFSPLSRRRHGSTRWPNSPQPSRFCSIHHALSFTSPLRILLACWSRLSPPESVMGQIPAALCAMAAVLPLTMASPQWRTSISLLKFLTPCNALMLMACRLILFPSGCARTRLRREFMSPPSSSTLVT